MQPGDTFVSNRFVTILVGEFRPYPPQKIGNILFLGYGNVPFGEEWNGRSLNGRTVDEWKWRANRPDNHWLDCLVGCAVAASMEGVELAAFRSKEVVQRPRIKLSDLQRNRHSR